MKAIILGDIHGNNIWKQITNQSFDKIIFLGDYFDSFSISGEDQCNNFKDICQFKRDNMDKVIMLIGNHDFHYYDFVNERYSGYQKDYQWIIQFLLNDNKDIMQMAYSINNILITHAGVSKTWLDNYKIQEEELPRYFTIDSQINDIWKYKPLSFKFTGNNIYGDSKESSPIWIRPKSLSLDGIEGLTQIVGHTQIKKLRTNTQDMSNKHIIWMCDTLNISKEYLIIENNEFIIKTI